MDNTPFEVNIVASIRKAFLESHTSKRFSFFTDTQVNLYCPGRMLALTPSGLIMRDNRVRLDTRGCIEGSPDFVVEVWKDLEPEAVRLDRINCWKRVGVPEIWEVYETPFGLHCNQWTITLDGLYKLNNSASAGEMVNSPMFNQLSWEVPKHEVH